MTDQIQESTSESGAWHSRRTSLTSDLKIYFWVPGVGKRLSIHSLMLHSTSLSTHNSTWLQAESLTWTPFLRSGPAAPVTGISSSTQNACLHNCQIGHKCINSHLCFPFNDATCASSFFSGITKHSITSPLLVSIDVVWMTLSQGSFHKCEQYVQIKGCRPYKLSRGAARLLPMETVTIYAPTSAYFPYQKVWPMMRQKSSEVFTLVWSHVHSLSQHWMHTTCQTFIYMASIKSLSTWQM